MLQNANDLDEVLKNIGVEISSDHCLQLFDKFAKKGKFEYLKFLMVFEPNDKIFLMATKLIIREYYKDDFEKFYKLGLAEGKKKWERGSLARIN